MPRAPSRRRPGGPTAPASAISSWAIESAHAGRPLPYHSSGHDGHAQPESASSVRHSTSARSGSQCDASQSRTSTRISSGWAIASTVRGSVAPLQEIVFRVLIPGGPVDVLERQQYDADGYVVREGVFTTAEIGEMVDACEAARRRPRARPPGAADPRRQLRVRSRRDAPDDDQVGGRQRHRPRHRAVRPSQPRPQRVGPRSSLPRPRTRRPGRRADALHREAEPEASAPRWREPDASRPSVLGRHRRRRRSRDDDHAHARRRDAGERLPPCRPRQPQGGRVGQALRRRRLRAERDRLQRRTRRPSSCPSR